MADDERAFRAWYSRMATLHGLGADPDDPQQFYDYRAAFRAGAKPDASGHWPSQFKREGHPNMVVGGFNVKTGERVPGTKRASESELVKLGWDSATAKKLAAMPEQDADPLVALLDKSGLSVAQKRGLWDLYTAAKDTGDLQKRLDALKLPDAVKHDLWSLKDSESDSEPAAEPMAPEPTATEPSAGYWEDRGIAGKVWHPASGVQERNRSDVQVLGVPPELAAIGAGAVGRAVVAPGLNAVGRVVAGATAAAGQAAPIVGYEVARRGLSIVGVPEPFASIGAGVIVARGMGRRGVATAESEAPVAAEAVAAETTPLGFPKGPPQPSALDVTKQTAAEWRRLRGIPAEGYPSTRPQGPPVNPLRTSPEAVKEEFKAFFKPALEQAAKVPKLTAEEMSVGAKLLKAGMSAPEVLQTIMKQRELMRSPSFARLPRP